MNTMMNQVVGFVGVNHSAVGAAAASVARSSAEGAGLVPYKTTLDSTKINPVFIGERVIDLGPTAVAERRIKKLKRSVWASGHLHALADNGYRPPVCWFVTLTYKPGIEWSSDHLGASVQGFRNWCQSRNVPCRYTWVAELQGRGAVHYHLLAWLPVGVRMPKWDRRPATARGKERKAFWSHGMTNVQVAKAGVGYIMKYLSKLGEFHRFPKGLRLYGVGGLNDTGRQVRQWYNLPEWVKSEYGVGDIIRRKIGLVVRATGEVLPSAFRVFLVPAGLVVRQLRELPARFHDGAYSSVSFA